MRWIGCGGFIDYQTNVAVTLLWRITRRRDVIMAGSTSLTCFLGLVRQPPAAALRDAGIRAAAT